MRIIMRIRPENMSVVITKAFAMIPLAQAMYQDEKLRKKYGQVSIFYT